MIEKYLLGLSIDSKWSMEIPILALSLLQLSNPITRRTCIAYVSIMYTCLKLGVVKVSLQDLLLISWGKWPKVVSTGDPQTPHRRCLRVHFFFSLLRLAEYRAFTGQLQCLGKFRPVRTPTRLTCPVVEYISAPAGQWRNSNLLCAWCTLVSTLPNSSLTHTHTHIQTLHSRGHSTLQPKPTRVPLPHKGRLASVYPRGWDLLFASDSLILFFFKQKRTSHAWCMIRMKWPVWPLSLPGKQPPLYSLFSLEASPCRFIVPPLMS